MMRYCFDLDGTLCVWRGTEPWTAEPIPERIAAVNALYDAGHRIIIDTSRGQVSGRDERPLAEQQLAEWGVRFHELHVGRKPYADHYVDDRATNAADFDWRAA